MSRKDIPLSSFQPDSSEGIRVLSEKRLFSHRYINVDAVTYESDRRSNPVEWVVAKRICGTVIAPRLADGRFLMIRQERYPIQKLLWEFPAGQIDAENWKDEPEQISETALRELREETGHELLPDGSLEHLGIMFASQGFTDEHVYLFLADGVQPVAGGASPDEGENILECRAFSLEEIRQMIAENELVDANSLALYARLIAREG